MPLDPIPPKVPFFGKVTLDDDERSCLQLPINFTSYQNINKTQFRQEKTATHTKSHWSRQTTGSPEYQEEDLQESNT